MTKRRDETYLIADKLEKAKLMGQDIESMANDVICMIVAQDKALIETFYNVLIGACRIYAVAVGLDTTGLRLARRSVLSCANAKNYGLEPSEILKHIW